MNTEHDHHSHDHFENHPDYCGLTVNKGIEQPPSVNPNLKKFRKKKRKQPTKSEFIEGIRKGNITLLSQAVTLVESNKPEHFALAQEIIDACVPHSGTSFRLGITGVPGVGKSTFIESMGVHALKKGKKLAVLAIDPSSERTKGSILGDKTRMERLSTLDKAYIRPSPSAGTLGGVAQKTRETIILCEAAGFDTIFVETVGVGQSETAVHSMVDFFLLLMLAGAGDELQGIKRGIMELADAITINKADGDNLEKAKRAAGDYRNALHLFPATKSGWKPDVFTCSAFYDKGMDELWDMLNTYQKFTKENQYFAQRRKDQNAYWMYETINVALKNHFYHHPDFNQHILEKENLVKNDKTSSFKAANDLINQYFNSLKQG